MQNSTAIIINLILFAKVMELVAFVGKDQENWGQISALINHGEWEKVVLVKSSEAEGFESDNETLRVNTSKPILELKEELMQKLKSKLAGDFEVSVSIASGNGKEHMALISALLSIPVGIRFVVFTKEGIKTIN
jgi:hypothetical protein